MKKIGIVAAVLAAIVALPGLGLAQESSDESIMWFSLMESKSGKGMDLVQTTIKNDGPMYDKLLASGAISGWGIALPINHRREDTWNHMLWVSMPDWSKVGDLQGGFMKLFDSRTPEQSKAIEAEYKASVEEGSHYDWIVRTQVDVNGENILDTSYIGTAYWRAKPGSGEKVTEFYKKHVAPIYAKLMADGAITGYGMFGQELHTDPSWTNLAWYGMTDLGSVDKVGKALEAGLADVDVSGVMEAMDPGGHWDQILLVVHMGGRTAGN